MIAAVGLRDFADYSAAAKALVHAEPLPLPDTALREFYKEKAARYRAGLTRAHAAP